jgi:Domain of unknown function (DUF1844)
MADSNDLSPDFPLPPASFAFLVESIMMQTQMQLGIFSLGDQEDDSEPNLPIARHSIDLLAVLEEKTRGNLSTEEQRMLENGLTELRFRFVQVSDELNRKQTQVQPADAGSAEKKAPEKPLIITADGGKGTKTA